MILAVLNISDGTWRVTDDGYSSLAIGFTSESNPTAFDDLKFGWSLTINGEEVDSASYPPENVSYLSTDQTYISHDNLPGKPDDDCSVAIYAVNGGTRYEHTYSWSIPKPDQPFKSWIWDDEISAWKAPVPMPTDEQMYAWDEDAGDWVVVPNPYSESE